MAEKTCVVCVEPIPATATKCLKCGSFQGVACVACRMPLPRDADQCTECKAFQLGGRCENCGASMPRDVLYCTTCSTFNDWRRWIPRNAIVLALIATILSLLTAILPPLARRWNNRSLTHVRLLGEDTDVVNTVRTPVLLAAVANSGSRPAVVRSAAIEFAKGRETLRVDLRIANVSEQLILPGRTKILKLTADTRTMTSEAYSGKNGNVTLKMDVEETTRFGNPDSHVRTDEVAAKVIESWIEPFVQ